MFLVRCCLLIAALLVGSFPQDVAAQTTHLKCYKAKDPLSIRGPGPAWLKLDAGGLGDENCRIVGGFRLVCVPSEAELTLPIEARMLTTGGPYLPLTPTILPSPEELSSNRLCYKIRCLQKPTISNDTAFTDMFGARTLSRYRPFLVCGPAEASLCGDGSVDFGEDCDDGNHVNGDCCSANCKAEPTTQTCGPDTDGEACTTPRCDGFGFCDQLGHMESTATSCPDTDGETCTKARCDGAGTCDQVGFLEPVTTSCPDTDGLVCTSARCDGAGACTQTGFLAPVTTSCPDTDGNECTSARCDGAGTCTQTGFVSPNGTFCIDTDGNVCTNAKCQGGSCLQNFNVAVGTSCPDSDGNACDQPGCDESGLCAQDFYIRNCDFPDVCNPGTGICQ